jgi:hypothetical protein
MKFTLLDESLQAAYSRAMAAAQRAHRVARPASVEQAPSTEAILKRDPSTDKAWQNRPLKRDAQVIGADGKVGLNERYISLEEASHFQAVRQRPKNTLGQSEGSSITVEKYWLAVQAWMRGGIRLSALEIEQLTLLGQLSRVSELLAQANTQEEFVKLMEEAGLRDIIMDKFKSGD